MDAQITNIDHEIHENKPQQSEATNRQTTAVDEINGSTSPVASKQEVIKNPRPIALCATSLLESDNGNVSPKEQTEFPILTERMSRIESVRHDARKLKTATLNRMGKMFKQRSQTPVADKSSLNTDAIMNVTKSVENYTDESPRKEKEKSNSLGRMLKLVDKDGSPRKLFHPRAGSLSRILRRHPNNENNDEKKPAEDSTPGIFTRMLSQLRGRPHSGNTTIEPNIKTRGEMVPLPPKVPLNPRPRNLSSPRPPSSLPSREKESSQKLTNFEYSL